MSARTPSDLIMLDGLHVPVGFLLSFVKKNHNTCLGRGYRTYIVAGKDNSRETLNDICTCVIDRARRENRRLGAPAFKLRANLWLEDYRRRIYPPDDSRHDKAVALQESMSKPMDDGVTPNNLPGKESM